MLTEEFSEDKFLMGIPVYPQHEKSLISKNVEEDLDFTLPKKSLSTRKSLLVFALYEIATTFTISITHHRDEEARTMIVADFVNSLDCENVIAPFPEKKDFFCVSFNANKKNRETVLKLSSGLCFSRDSFSYSFHKLIGISSKLSKADKLANSAWRSIKQLFCLLDEKYDKVCRTTMFLVCSIIFKNVLMRAVTTRSLDVYDLSLTKFDLVAFEFSEAMFSGPARKLGLDIACFKAILLDARLYETALVVYQFMISNIRLVMSKKKTTRFSPSLLQVPTILSSVLKLSSQLVVDRAIIYLLIYRFFNDAPIKIDITSLYSSNHKLPGPCFYIAFQDSREIIFEHK